MSKIPANDASAASSPVADERTAVGTLTSVHRRHSSSYASVISVLSSSDIGVASTSSRIVTEARSTSASDASGPTDVTTSSIRGSRPDSAQWRR